MTDLVILLLAAGASTRMRGGDKLLEPVKGMPLLRRQVLAALAGGLPVLVALPVPQGARQAALAGLPVQKVPVADAGHGMGHSIAAGARAAPGGTALMLLAADMPGIGAAEIDLVVRAFRSSPDRIWRGMSDGTPGHPVVFPARLLAELGALTGDQGARAIVAREGALPVPLPGDAATLDLDTPEAWADWRRRSGNPAP
jgi:CTP:molybdopterin cytidylyltransferase MocA